MDPLNEDPKYYSQEEIVQVLKKNIQSRIIVIFFCICCQFEINSIKRIHIFKQNSENLMKTQKGAINIQRCYVESQKGTIDEQRLWRYLAPFWFSMEFLWTVIVPLWLSNWQYRQLRARRALLQLKDVPLRTRRVLLLYKVNGNSALLVLNGISLNSDSAPLALSWQYEV